MHLTHNVILIFVECKYMDSIYYITLTRQRDEPISATAHDNRQSSTANLVLSQRVILQ